MKTSTKLLCTIGIIAATAFTFSKPVKWNVKDNYSVKFESGKMHGAFKGLGAMIMFDEANPQQSVITATIDATTLEMGNGAMTEHAKSEEALNTSKFPVITFESTGITKTATGYEAKGKLTLKGVTKEIKFPFFFDSEKPSAQFPLIPKETFNGTMTIMPKEFNITRKGTPETMMIELNIPVSK